MEIVWLSEKIGGIHILGTYQKWVKRKYLILACFRSTSWNRVHLKCDIELSKYPKSSYASLLLSNQF
jgi:hypothetical protein